ncbi:winged helix-turn-helix transcriptional regulator [Sphingobium xenophagum]|uniref:winged helix-turn-helix transcriptional regulator n=1 Tax=Sphingobium xenophagum TaxID=121428 RepID=UPI0009D9AC72|nr:DnaA N-terminal domain-containing protein [Sphingobium xenophagum]
MSWEAENWARQQRTGDPVTKAVLVGIANWMNPKGDQCQVSMRRLADEVEISIRTAQRHVQRLEEMGFVEKSGAVRSDGGQGWNSFRFPGYRPPKVSHVAPPGKASDPHDKLTGGEGDKLTPPHDRLSPSPASDCHGEGDTAMSGEGSDKDNKTPHSPPRGDDDAGKRNRGTRIPEDWKPPAITALPPAAKAKARQWPAGAYEAEAEAFLNFWRGEGRAGSRKLDWTRTWCNRINEITGRVLRDARSGVRHSAPATSPVQPAKAHDTSRENAAAAKIRALVKVRVGDQVYGQWVAPCRLDIDAGTVTAVAVSSFASNYLRDNFGNEIGQAMHTVLGPDADLRFTHEAPPA